MTLSATYPKGHEHRMSYETIYNCIYAQPVGQQELDAIADEINNRPHKGLGVRSPLTVYRELLANSHRRQIPRPESLQAVPPLCHDSCPVS
jgi:IS30 family transposase